MSQPPAPQQPPRPPRDPYPRMILVCIGISATLFIVIAAAVMIDFVMRTKLGEEEAQPAGFETLLEKPREAYTQP